MPKTGRGTPPPPFLWHLWAAICIKFKKTCEDVSDIDSYGNTGCGVFKWGIQKWKGFWLKINILTGNYWILQIGVVGRGPMCQNLIFKVNFQCQIIIGIFLNFLRSTFLGCWCFFDSINFKSLLFLKWCPIFDSLPLVQFSKFNDFFCVCWFFAKNQPNFVPLPWKLYIRYCHIDNQLTLNLKSAKTCYLEVWQYSHLHL